MKQSIKTILTSLSVIAALLFPVMAPLTAHAAGIDPLGTACKQGTNQSSQICKANQPAQSGVFTILKNVINILLIVVGIVAVIMIVVGGLRYVLSAGDSNAINGAKNTILYAVVGLVIAVLSFSIVNFVLTKL